MTALVTASRLREILNYDSKTGQFTWLISISRGAKPGRVAGCLKKDGYVYIKIKRKDYTAGRLAWFYVNGEWPKYYIDHIDGNKSNNQISNLRDVDNSTNQQNRKTARLGNKSGFLGVCKSGKKFVAQIMVNRKAKHLGAFKNAKDAHQAYLNAKRQLHPGCTI